MNWCLPKAFVKSMVKNTKTNVASVSDLLLSAIQFDLNHQYDCLLDNQWLRVDINKVKHMVAFNGEYHFKMRSGWMLRVHMVDKLGEVMINIDVFAMFLT